MFKWTIILIALVLVITASASIADSDVVLNIPPKSLDKLQNIFGKVTDILWEKSDDYFHEGQYDRVIATVRLITEMDPTDTEAFAIGYWILDSSDREAEGVAFLEKGLALNPNRYEMYRELGQHYMHINNYAKAADYLAKAVAFKDCPIILWHTLAHAYERSGNLEKSIETWEHAAVLEPGDPVVAMNLNRVKEALAAKTKAP